MNHAVVPFPCCRKDIHSICRNNVRVTDGMPGEKPVKNMLAVEQRQPGTTDLSATQGFSTGQ